MFHNIIVGKTLSQPWELLSSSQEEWEKFDKRDTLFTNERFLPAILVEAGVVNSRSEVRRNKPELCKFLIGLNFVDISMEIKWGKNLIYIVIGYEDL